MPLACLVAVWAVPRSAWAAGDFEGSLRAAVRLYESLEYEKALEELQKARRQARGSEQEVSVSLHEGIFLGDMGQRDEARAAFRKGLLLDPGAQLPLKASPKLERDFEAVRDEVIEDLEREAQERAERERQGLPPVRATEDRPERSASPDLNPSQTKWPVKVWSPGPVEEVPGHSHVRTVVPLVLTGAGVVSAGAGIVFGLVSRSNVSKLRHVYADGRLPASTELASLDDLHNDARGQARMANVLFGAAVVTVGGAVAIWLLGSDDKDVEPRGER